MKRYKWETFDCSECGETVRGFIIKGDGLVCRVCQGEGPREFNRDFTVFSFKPYFDEGLGKHVSTRRGRQEEIQRQGLVEVGGTSPEDYHKYVKTEDPFGGTEKFNDIYQQVKRGEYERG